MMETFCTEPLEIGSYTITFSSETKKHRPPKLLNISFLNAPPETLEDILTEFVNEYADIKGFPFYPKKVHDGISYCTGARVYQVSKLIPRKLYNMFGRTVIGIYNNQPNDNPRPRRPEYTPNETYSDYDTDTTQAQTDTESKNETENQAETQNKPKNKPQKDVKNSELNIHEKLQSSNTPEYTMDKKPPEKKR